MRLVQIRPQRGGCMNRFRFSVLESAALFGGRRMRAVVAIAADDTDNQCYQLAQKPAPAAYCFIERKQIDDFLPA